MSLVLQLSPFKFPNLNLNIEKYIRLLKKSWKSIVS